MTATDDVHDAVESAISEGWTVQRFVSEAAAAWYQYLRDRQAQDQKTWERIHGAIP